MQPTVTSTPVDNNRASSYTNKRRPSSVRNKHASRTTPKAKQAAAPILTIRGLIKGFSGTDGSHYPILRGIDLQAQRGDTIAIMGRSGSGKSTLISIVTGLDKPDAGTVQINGAELTTLNEAELTQFRAANIGIVFQQFHLISHLNALANVTLPLHLNGVRENITERAETALAQVGLTQRKQQLPNKLSGGEQQRLAIARALVSRPSILLADEPTGNLDTETSKGVIQQLFNVVKRNNITLFLVTHDLLLAKQCKRRYRLENGILKAFR